MSLLLFYNEKGESKGVASVQFKSPKFAETAFKKFNNAPIDNGKSKMKIELVLDALKIAPAVPLAKRILVNGDSQKPKTKAEAKAKKLAELKKKTVAKAKAKAKVKAALKNKTKKPKTMDDLDQEMSDYFDKK